jgi:hypothetical protein
MKRLFHRKLRQASDTFRANLELLRDTDLPCGPDVAAICFALVSVLPPSTFPQPASNPQQRLPELFRSPIINNRAQLGISRQTKAP